MLIFLVSQFLPVIDGINSTQTKIAQTLIPLPKKVPIKKTDIEIMVVFGRINF
jgi:hypothetical protein